MTDEARPVRSPTKRGLLLHAVAPELLAGVEANELGVLGDHPAGHDGVFTHDPAQLAHRRSSPSRSFQWKSSIAVTASFGAPPVRAPLASAGALRRIGGADPFR